MGLYKNKYGVWQASFTPPGGERIRRSLKTTNKKHAQELYDKLKSESWRVSQRLDNTPNYAFEEACVRWIKEKYDKKSLDDDKTKISYFIDFFSGMNVSEITTEKITDAVDKLYNRKHRQRWEMQRERLTRLGKSVPEYQPEPVSAQTRHSYLSFMRGLLNACRRWGWLKVVPHINTKQPPNKRIRWITPDEVAALFRELPENFKPFFLFALSTGLRRSNIINLEWSQVDLEQRIAWIHPDQFKSKKAVGFPLNDTAYQAIISQQGKHNKYIFVREYKGQFVKFRVDDNTAWRNALTRAGIEDFRFHDLRHTWASWLVQSDVPKSIVKDLGGWESMQMVERYAHLSAGHLSKHAAPIDKKIGKILAKFEEITD